MINEAVFTYVALMAITGLVVHILLPMKTIIAAVLKIFEYIYTTIWSQLVCYIVMTLNKSIEKLNVR